MFTCHWETLVKLHFLSNRPDDWRNESNTFPLKQTQLVIIPVKRKDASQTASLPENTERKGHSESCAGNGGSEATFHNA